MYFLIIHQFLGDIQYKHVNYLHLFQAEKKKNYSVTYSTHPLTFSKNSGGRSRRTRLMKMPYRSSAGPSAKFKMPN